MKNLAFEKYFHYLIIAYAFVLPITIAGIVLIEHLIIITFVIGYIKGYITPSFSELKKSKTIVVLFIFLILSFISIIWSEDKVFALLYIKKYYHLLLIPIIYLSFNIKYIKSVFTGFLFGMLLSEVFSYLIFLEVIQYNNIPSNNPSPFMNHSIYSIYLAFTAMILINRLFFVENYKHKLFYFLYFLTTTSNLFLNGGRTGQIIFVISLFIVLILNFKNKITGALISTILVTSIVVTAYSVSPIFQERGKLAYTDITRTISEKDYSQSFGQRVSLWIMGAEVFKDNILLGTGIGDEKSGMQKYANKYNITLYKNLPDKGHIDYHNLYMQHAVQLGIPGLILMLALIYSLFTIKFKSNLYRNIHIAFTSAIIISSTVSNFLHTIFPVVFFVFFVAVLSAVSRSETQNQC